MTSTCLLKSQTITWNNFSTPRSLFIEPEFPTSWRHQTFSQTTTTMTDFQLNITPLKPDGKLVKQYLRGLQSWWFQGIPSEESILAAAKAVLESTNSWKEGKSFHKKTVKTFSRPKGPGDGAGWHCRLSEHHTDDATFDEFWGKLGVDHAENEKQCVVLHFTEAVRISLIQQQIYSCPEKGQAGQEDLWDSVYLDAVLYLPASRISTRLHCLGYDPPW